MCQIRTCRTPKCEKCNAHKEILRKRLLKAVSRLEKKNLGEQGRLTRGKWWDVIKWHLVTRRY